MDLEVVGRHALLFDEDATAAFVNSGDALVDWNSLLIDRYDVRHLLSVPPPPRKRRQPPSSVYSSLTSSEPELDQERYLDLPPLSHELESDGLKPVEDSGYRAVAFSYGSTEVPTEQRNTGADLGCSRFFPPFPVPESLFQSLPPSEKVHQIIARTATFVSKNGGQSEIVLRVKQGDNPTFGFLMPDHHLHPYFRFLVDNQELLQSDIDVEPHNEDKKSVTGHNQTDEVGSGALSLLGSLYGAGEDEDDAAAHAEEPNKNMPGETSDPDGSRSHNLEQKEVSMKRTLKDKGVSKHLLSSKEKASVTRKDFLHNPPKVGSARSLKKEDGSIGSVLAAAEDKSLDYPLAISKMDVAVLEPPSDTKRLVDRIVEFIMKNGKQVETILIQQDIKNGRFPFLLPSNQYHPYYLKVLQKAQESKLTGKSFLSERDELFGPGLDKKGSLSKEKSTLSPGVTGWDIPYDSDRKEKFKMVIGKSKKDWQDQSSKSTPQEFEVTVDAAAAAAILQAATRGIKNPDLGFLSSTSVNGHGRNSEGGQSSSLGSLPSTRPENGTHKSESNGGRLVSIPAATEIAKTAALEAAMEADSSEAHLTKEQKLKAERLKRAKMFVAMLKSGPAPIPMKTESRGLSAEPQTSGISGAGAGTEFVPVAEEREGSSVPVDIDTSNKNVNYEKKLSDDERRLRRKYRSRDSKHEEDEEGEDEEEKEHDHLRKKYHSRGSLDENHGKEETDEERRGSKHSNKKHKRHRSSHKEEDENDDEKHYKCSKKHRSRCSSHEDDEENYKGENDHKRSRKKRHSHQHSCDDYEDHDGGKSRHSKAKHQSSRSSRHSKDKHKHQKRHSSSKDKESQQRHKHDSSSEDGHRHQSRSTKHTKRSRSEREELEEGEISAKVSDQSREASLDLASLYQEQRVPSQPSGIKVSDDLRAKIRAMLRATL